ncbi:hypothetical protein [Kitasatospora sp. NPDC056800]|uniref:hypothetical protein n=1 Tax=Kitasatospora sp. NPDC056800 TaxID=3345948 RepID=UPI0036741780
MDRGPGAAGSWPEAERAALAGAGGRGGGGDREVTVGDFRHTARPAGRGPVPPAVGPIGQEDSAVLVQERIAGPPSCRGRVAARPGQAGGPARPGAVDPSGNAGPSGTTGPSDPAGPSSTTGVSGA